MDSLRGYGLRAPTWDDLVDAGRVVLGTGFLRGQWERSGFVLTSDAWVAVDGAGTVMGYGQVTRSEPGQELVDGEPGFRHSANSGDEAAAPPR